MELKLTFINIIIGIVFLFLGYTIGKLVTEIKWKVNLPKLRQESVKKSREVLTGHFSEQLAPYMPNFPFSPTECKFLGKPIDLIVFKGLDNKETKEVVFVEIKSGESKLTATEKHLKDAINNKKVSWYEYRVNKKKL